MSLMVSHSRCIEMTADRCTKCTVSYQEYTPTHGVDFYFTLLSVGDAVFFFFALLTHAVLSSLLRE